MGRDACLDRDGRIDSYADLVRAKQQSHRADAQLQCLHYRNPVFYLSVWSLRTRVTQGTAHLMAVCMAQSTTNRKPVMQRRPFTKRVLRDNDIGLPEHNIFPVWTGATLAADFAIGNLIGRVGDLPVFDGYDGAFRSCLCVRKEAIHNMWWHYSKSCLGPRRPHEFETLRSIRLEHNVSLSADQRAGTDGYAIEKCARYWALPLVSGRSLAPA